MPVIRPEISRCSHCLVSVEVRCHNEYPVAPPNPETHTWWGRAAEWGLDEDRGVNRWCDHQDSALGTFFGVHRTGGVALALSKYTSPYYPSFIDMYAALEA